MGSLRFFINMFDMESIIDLEIEMLYFEKGGSMGVRDESGMIFNVLIKKDDGIFVAHCLELDIVATAFTLKQATNDMFDLIRAQVVYAFSNNNLDNLYHPAPPEVWKEFYTCKERLAKKLKLGSGFRSTPKTFVPPWIITNTCQLTESCRA